MIPCQEIPPKVFLPEEKKPNLTNLQSTIIQPQCSDKCKFKIIRHALYLLAEN